jgi:hypothetical protein
VCARPLGRPITFTFANAGMITVPAPVDSDTALPAGCAG